MVELLRKKQNDVKESWRGWHKPGHSGLIAHILDFGCIPRITGPHTFSRNRGHYFILMDRMI